VPVARISGLGTLATQNGTFSGTSSGNNTGDQALSGYATLAGNNTFSGNNTFGQLNSANQTVTGNVAVQGSTTLGDATGDTLTISGPITAAGATAVTANDVANVGALDGRYKVMYAAVKASSTSRNSTTTLTADPDLQFASVDAGIYEIMIRYQVVDTNQFGFKWALGGTAASGVTTLGRWPFLTTFGLFIGTSNIKDGEVVPTYNATRVAQIHATVNISSSGSLTFDWSQTNSSVANCTLNAGATIMLTRLQ
jgi:hypothetical protein